MSLRRWLADYWAVAVLVALMLTGLIQGLADAGWLPTPDVLWVAGLAAVPLGLLAGWRIRQPAVVVALALISGLLFSAEYHSAALPPAGPALGELAADARWAADQAAGPLVHFIKPDSVISPQPAPDLPEWRAAGERLALYGWNIAQDWPPRIVKGQLKANAILVSSLLGLLVWALTCFSLWVVLRRRSMWAALLPIAALLAVSAYFTAQGWWYLALSVIAGLLLTGEFAQRRLLGRWRSDDLPYGLDLDRWMWSSIVAGGAGLAMLLAVTLTDPQTRRWVDETFFPKPPPTVVSRPGPRPSGGTPVPAVGVMPEGHLLGSGPELSKQTAMWVRTPGVAPASFYWRAIAYNKYTGHGWLLSLTDQDSTGSPSPWPASPEPPQHLALLRQTFQLEGGTTQVYAAGRPVRLNQPAKGDWLAPDGADLLMVTTLIPQSGYEVLSWASTATPGDLRGAPADYPQWVRDGYLGLPDTLPKRVRALALTVTAGAKTPYDRALAIQEFLRTYPYTLDLAAPPPDRDVADYFLFDLRRGYCDYDATAMVVLARSAGLPARLAMGFSTGQYDPQAEAYRVSMADAHSWPEVYFPDYGWIAFEPTAGFAPQAGGPAADWVAQARTAQQDNIQTFPQAAPVVAETGPSWPLIGGLGGAAIIGVLLAALNAYRWHRRRSGAPGQIIGGLYRDLLIGGRRLGIAPAAAQTPDEFLHALLGELARRANRAPRWSGDWAARQAALDRGAGDLVSLYTRLAYSPHQPAGQAARAALDAWPGLSRRLWAFWLVGLLTPWRRG